MSSVDDRIVNMQFNNKQFEAGASQSARTLQNLENGIAKAGGSKGLEQLGTSANGLKGKFSAMQVAGVAAIATIASKATAAGLKLAKSMTIDPIMQGWEEYNTNLKSIQTVMANTGANVDTVNGYMKKLNDYSDQTIYNFSEMAKNIGTFTAAGVGLKQSVSAIQGISNVAALSGSSSQQASNAMYQLSQAIAAGRVNLQDWNSVVNAGMGGKNFQTMLIQTGQAMGTLSKDAVKFGKTIKVNGASFRESISAKPGQTAWLTSDVLVKTLGLMDGRLSKAAIAAKNFKLDSAGVNAELKKQQDILRKQGYNEEQIKNLTRMADAAYQSATVVKTLPQLIGVVQESIGSVWAQAFQAILGDFNQSKKLWTAASNSIGGIVQGFGRSLVGTIEQWKALGGRGNMIAGFRDSFVALGKILGAVKDAFRDIFPPTAGKSLASFSRGFREFAAALIPSENTVKSIRSIFGGLFAVLHIGMTVVKGVASAFGAFFKALFQSSSGASGGILSLLGTVGEAVKAFDKWFTSGNLVVNTLKTIGFTIGAIIQPLVKGIGLVVQAISALASGQGMAGFMEPFNEAKAAFLDFIASIAGGLARVTAPIGWLSELFTTIQTKANSLKASFEGFTGSIDLVGAAGGQLNATMGRAGGVFDKVSGSFQRVKGSVDGIKTSVSGMYATISGGGASNAVTQSGALASAGEGAAQGWSRAKGTFQTVGDVIKSVWDGLAKAAGFVKRAWDQMFGDMDALDFASIINAVIAGSVMLTLRSYINLLKDGFEAVSGFGKTFIGVFEQLTDTLSAMQKAVKAEMIRNIALAVALLTASVIALSFIDPKKIAISLGAIAIMMGMLVGSLTALNKIDEKGLMSMGAAMLLVSTAMIQLSTAVAILGNLDMSTLAKGLGAMAIGMSIMVGSLTQLAGLGPVAKGAAGGMILMAIAMNILAGAVAIFGNMDLKTLAKGLGAMAVGLGLMTASLLMLTMAGPGAAAAGAGILLVATAMNILAGAVLAFGSMDMAVLAQGMGALTFALIIFSTALGGLGMLGPAVLAAGGAMMMMAAAMGMLVPVILSLGMMPWETLKQGLIGMAIAMGIFVVGLAALGAISAVFGGALMMLGAALALAGVGMLAFGTGFALMTAAGVAGVAVLTAAFTAFMAMLPQIAIQAAAAFVSFLEAFAKAAPRARAAMNKIMSMIIGVIRDNIPKFRNLIQDLINAGIDVLGNSISRFVDMGFKVIDRFLKAADKRVPGIVRTATDVIVKFLNGIGNAQNRIVDAGFRMIIKFINGITNAINNNVDDLRRAGADLAMAIVNGMTGGLGGWAVDRLRSAVNALVSHIPARVRKLLGIASPSKEAIYWGKMVGLGLAGGLYASIKWAVGGAIAMANAVIAAGSSSVAKAQDAARAAQIKADKAQARVNARKLAASKIRTRDPALYKRMLALAKRDQKTATALQKRANSAAARVTAAQEWEKKSLTEKGDFRFNQAKSQALTAQRLMAKANAEAAQATALMRRNRAAGIAMLRQARKDAAAAKRYADAAQKSNASAESYYRQEVDAMIKAYEETEQARKDQAEFEAATDEGKAAILESRSAANQAKAEAAQAEATRLLNEAKVTAATDARKALELVTLAQEKSDAAHEAAEQAKKEKEEALQLLQQAGQASGGGSTIQPSRSILEDAASVVDRYTASLAAAQELAGSGEKVVQFVQNNNSPKALSASEIYRQTNNLLSAQQIKMGAN